MKIGVLGLGQMAQGMAWTIQHLPEAESWACASRSLDKAIEFQRRYGFRHAYDSYEKLYNDPEVELIYIATPHSLHFEQVKSALLHGKHVLCEKAFTTNLKDAEVLVSLAQEKNLFLMEAQMLRFMPLAKTLQKILREKIIGDVVSFTANFHYPLTTKTRVMSPEMGGGVMMDIGVYPLTMADLIMGHDYTTIYYDTIPTDTGVDGTVHLYLRTRQGGISSITTSIFGSRYQDGVIVGTNGYLILRDVNHLNRIELYDSNRCWQRNWEKPEQLSDYAHELSAAIRAIEAGKTQCDEYPWDLLLLQQKLLEQICTAYTVETA